MQNWIWTVVTSRGQQIELKSFRDEDKAREHFKRVIVNFNDVGLEVNDGNYPEFDTFDFNSKANAFVCGEFCVKIEQTEFEEELTSMQRVILHWMKNDVYKKEVKAKNFAKLLEYIEEEYDYHRSIAEMALEQMKEFPKDEQQKFLDNLDKKDDDDL
jgi:hypothetical protein